jgi:hypothetical protein
MRLAVALATLGGIVLPAAGAMLAAPGQQDRPGQIGQNKVWIENRGRNEAVPVAIQEVTTSTPIGVQVIGTPTVAVTAASVVQARLVRQAWEYRTVNIATGQDASPMLSTAGADGWEAAGIQFTTPLGTAFVLKRPR